MNCSKCRNQINRSFIIAIIAIVGLFAAALIKAGGSGVSEQKSVVYFTEDTIMLADLTQKSEPAEIAVSWYRGHSNAALIGIKSTNYLSKDGNYLYYMDDCVGAESYMLFDLYRRSVSKPEDTVKIDTEVGYFEILDNGHVIYRSKGVLYYHDGEKRIRLGRNVYEYHLNKDQSYLLSVERDNNYGTELHYQPLNQSKEKTELMSQISGDIYFYDDNLENIYVYDDHAIYRVRPDEKPEQIIKEVEYVVSCAPETGAIYFVREGQGKVALYYYLDGTEELISGDIVYDSYKSYTSDDGVYCLFRENDGEERAYRLSIGASIVELGENQADTWSAYYQKTEAAGRLYLLNHNDEAAMYEVEIDEKPGKPKKLDTEVSAVASVTGNGVYYLKDSDTDSGSLYFNGELIMSGINDVMRISESNQVVLATEWDRENGCVTIMICDGNNLTRVAENIAAVEASSDGTLLMLSDFDTRLFRSDLLYYDGSNVNVIAKRIRWFAARYNSNYKNY